MYRKTTPQQGDKNSSRGEVIMVHHVHVWICQEEKVKKKKMYICSDPSNCPLFFKAFGVKANHLLFLGSYDKHNLDNHLILMNDKVICFLD